MTAPASIGLTGLAVMGQNLARNIASRGFPVVVHNRSRARTDEILALIGPDEPITAADDLPALVAALAPPRAVIVMVKAGPPVDAVLDELLGLLSPGDMVIDGGNSFFSDTIRREARAAEHDVSYLGTGISGGEEGALRGPSIMPGGRREAYEAVSGVLTAIAAQVDGTPCCRWIGPGAGHYVKMVHNGIEYADIQLIAEAYDLLRSVNGLKAPELAAVFAEWNTGELESFLISIAATVLAKTDASGASLVDVIWDAAEQKGTGRWTAQDALELGVAAPSMTTAVYARSLSAQKAQRERAAAALAGPTPGTGAGAGLLVSDVRDALFASKIVAYAEGFAQLTAAGREHGWDLDLSGLATIWRGGCIIRARFLDRIREAYEGAGADGVENLMLLPFFAEALAGAQDAWRRVVATGVAHGVPMPAFSAALAYYDGYRQAAGPANLIQGLRDFFGAHGYRRTDREGSFHTRWAQDGTEIPAG
jgi:6-phosphogluconate dehydrogenase